MTTNELGREMTTAERIALATGRITMMDILHGVALDMDAERGAEVVTVTASGLVITRAMLADEVRATRAPSTGIYSGPMPQVIGLNASANMLAG